MQRIRAQRHEAGERRGRPPVAPPQRLISSVRSAVGVLRRAVDAVSGVELDANDTRELAALADQVAVLQAAMRYPRGVALSDPCAGPGTVAKVAGDGVTPMTEEERERGAPFRSAG